MEGCSFYYFVFPVQTSLKTKTETSVCSGKIYDIFIILTFRSIQFGGLNKFTILGHYSQYLHPSLSTLGISNKWNHLTPILVYFI